MNLIGLKLDEAQKQLAEQGFAAEKIVVRETAPPKPEKAIGDWRVLRFQCSEDGACAIVAAREQIHESPRPSSRSSAT
jgi:hypothetical protein